MYRNHASQIVRVRDLSCALLEGACNLDGRCMDGPAYFRIVEPNSELPASVTSTYSKLAGLAGGWCKGRWSFDHACP